MSGIAWIAFLILAITVSPWWWLGVGLITLYWLLEGGS
jgi:hypothetical protein